MYILYMTPLRTLELFHSVSLVNCCNNIIAMPVYSISYMKRIRNVTLVYTSVDSLYFLRDTCLQWH